MKEPWWDSFLQTRVFSSWVWLLHVLSTCNFVKMQTSNCPISLPVAVQTPHGLTILQIISPTFSVICLISRSLLLPGIMSEVRHAEVRGKFPRKDAVLAAGAWAAFRLVELFCTCRAGLPAGIPWGEDVFDRKRRKTQCHDSKEKHGCLLTLAWGLCGGIKGSAAGEQNLSFNQSFQLSLLLLVGCLHKTDNWKLRMVPITVKFMLISVCVSKGCWAVWSQSEKTGSSQTGDGEEICWDAEETVRQWIDQLMDSVYGDDQHISPLSISHLSSWKSKHGE